jgi:peptidoglycan/xylan/chitin deacetylase (PgdA/CDA1 family)
MTELRATTGDRSSLRQLRSAAAPLAKSALLRIGGYAALRRVAPSHGLAILRYHAICGDEGHAYADPSICISPESFEQHVAYLTRSYNVVRLEDAARALREGAPLPPNAVALTFDDGYADNLAAARTLARYGASATFYLTAGCLEGGQPFWPVEVRYLVRALPPKRYELAADPARVEIDATTDEGRRAAVKRLTKAFKGHAIPVREALRQRLRELAGSVDIPRVMLTWDEVREMHRLGMTIGSHTMTHPNLPNAGLDAARQELAESKTRLEAMIHAPVTMFSYPNGGADRYCTPELKKVVAEVGFAAATTSRNAFAGPKSDLYGLERIEVEERLADLVFALEVERFAFQPAPRALEAES